MSGMLLAALWLAAAAPATPPLGYRLVEVRSKVVITHEGAEHRATRDEIAAAGDELRTGMFGHATLLVAERASRFEVFSSTRVRLAGPEPGVLVVLERGRLKALFDALTGAEERLVATPGAVLAVRGTQYGVEVDAAGNGAIAVFEGVVEVRPRTAGLTPVAVAAGEMCSFAPGRAPRRRMMPMGMTQDNWDHAGAMGGMGGMGPGMGRPGTGPEPPGRDPGNMGHRPPGDMSGPHG